MAFFCDILKEEVYRAAEEACIEGLLVAAALTTCAGVMAVPPIFGLCDSELFICIPNLLNLNIGNVMEPYLG